MNRARPFRNLVLGALIVALLAVPASEASAQGGAGALERYAAATWRSFVAMTDEESGLPADTLHFDGSRSVQTSTTNIGPTCGAPSSPRSSG